MCACRVLPKGTLSLSHVSKLFYFILYKLPPVCLLLMETDEKSYRHPAKTGLGVFPIQGGNKILRSSLCFICEGT